jgi:hypothetical protein
VRGRRHSRIQTKAPDRRVIAGSPRAPKRANRTKDRYSDTAASNQGQRKVLGLIHPQPSAYAIFKIKSDRSLEQFLFVSFIYILASATRAIIYIANITTILLGKSLVTSTHKDNGR